MLKDIVFVEPLDVYRLRLRFEDGVEGVVDVSEITTFEGVFEPLKEKSYFDKVRLNSELGIIQWENGADLAPIVLYSKITGESIPDYLKSAYAKRSLLSKKPYFTNGGKT